MERTRKECEIRDNHQTLREAWHPMEERTVTPDEIVESFRLQKFLLQCPVCREKVTPVCGKKLTHHFRHFRDGQDGERKGERHNEDGGPSAWHRLWQQRFPKETREQLCVDPAGNRRRGDVVLENEKIIIEIQKGDFTGFQRDEARARTEFWNGLGFKIIWLFCLEEQSGYLGLPEGGISKGFAPMVMYLDNFEKLIEEYDRTKIEVHFLDLHGKTGYEFIPLRKDTDEMLAVGVGTPSYFLPFAPYYQDDLERLRADLADDKKAVIDHAELLQAMSESKTRIEDYLKSLKKTEKKKAENLFDVVHRDGFTLYDIIIRSLAHHIRVLIVKRPNKNGEEMDEYQIFPQDFEYFIEKYAGYPQYTFRVKGKRRKNGAKEFTAVDEIFSPDKKIWIPAWAANMDGTVVDVKKTFGM